MTDNTMTRRKRSKPIYKTLHRKLMIEQHEIMCSGRVSSSCFMLLLLQTKWQVMNGERTGLWLRNIKKKNSLQTEILKIGKFINYLIKFHILYNGSISSHGKNLIFFYLYCSSNKIEKKNQQCAHVCNWQSQWILWLQ